VADWGFASIALRTLAYILSRATSRRASEIAIAEHADGSDIRTKDRVPTIFTVRGRLREVTTTDDSAARCATLANQSRVREQWTTVNTDYNIKVGTRLQYGLVGAYGTVA
jgi:hypothetical protein